MGKGITNYIRNEGKVLILKCKTSATYVQKLVEDRKWFTIFLNLKKEKKPWKKEKE